MILEFELALMLLLIGGYIGINFAADLPRFLVGENLFYTLLYITALLALYRHVSWAQPYTILISAFNAGRVSRSIVSPRGEIGELAVQHVPLFLLILSVLLVAFYSMVK